RPSPSLASRKPSMPIRPLCLSGKLAGAEASRELNKRPDGMDAAEDSMDDAPDERDDFSDWEQAEDAAHAAFGETLVVDVEGFEGPLDLLLALARTQKVDLARISVLALAQQYLDFIAEARKLRLEIAADYLVMAAWLAFLKSKLLLPAEQDAESEPTGEELAQLLALPPKRPDAMPQVAAAAL